MSEPTLGETIRAARLARGSKNSLREYARILEISPSYLSDIERDLRVPSEHHIEVIAFLFGLDFDVLMAKAGRLGEGAERYMRRHPTACMLMKAIVDGDLSDRDLRGLVAMAKDIGESR